MTENAAKDVRQLVRHRSGSVGVAILFLALAMPAGAQVDDRLEAYTGRNATGYLAPLVDAFRSNLNSGLFHSAHVPRDGFHVGLELSVMMTPFDEDSRTFLATTEEGFSPEQTVRVPTVIGDPDAVIVDGDAGTQFAFPGGFDVAQTYFGSPLVRVGSWKGTEALGRFMLWDTGISELGRLSVWGVGVRHSVSQYIPSTAPIDIAAGVHWQQTKLENESSRDVMKARVVSFNVHTSTRYRAWEPYLGVTIDWFVLDVEYEFEDIDGTEPIDLEFRSDADLQLTLGVSYRVGPVAAFGEYNLAEQNSLAAGLSVNFPSSDRSVTQ